MSAVSLWPDLGSCLPQIKSISATYFRINNSHVPPSSISLVEENEKPFLLERCAPQGAERGNRKCREESGRQKGEELFPSIITISGSFCSVVVTGSIASIIVPLSAMWSHNKLAMIHQSSELIMPFPRQRPYETHFLVVYHRLKCAFVMIATLYFLIVPVIIFF